jgi:hypothetical protein
MMIGIKIIRATSILGTGLRPGSPAGTLLRRAGAVLALTVLVGCQRSPAPPPAPHPAAPPPPATAVDIGAEPLKPGIGTADQALADRVRTRLASDPRLHGLKIDVDAQGGRVTLWGHVASRDLKTVAGQLAQQTPGASSIANLIAVDAASSGPSPRP